VIFRLLSILLRYPDDEVLEHREAIAGAARELPPSPAREHVARFLAYWEGEPAFRLQADYAERFDFKRRGCLYLSYYRYGDQRARGQVLADMKALYAAAGYPLDTTELPDYLPLVLEFASEAPEAGLPMLAENRAAIEVIRRSLHHDKSPYALLLEALCCFLPGLDETTVAEMQKLIVQGPPQETVGLEPYSADAPPGRPFDEEGAPREAGRGAERGAERGAGNVVFLGRKP
jgi:nitrate reductase molybdenum cofactor assembly chaperone NarJ/NarW